MTARDGKIRPKTTTSKYRANFPFEDFSRFGSCSDGSGPVWSRFLRRFSKDCFFEVITNTFEKLQNNSSTKIKNAGQECGAITKNLAHSAISVRRVSSGFHLQGRRAEIAVNGQRGKARFG
jgi:hypothetical protein